MMNNDTKQRFFCHASSRGSLWEKSILLVLFSVALAVQVSAASSVICSDFKFKPWGTVISSNRRLLPKKLKKQHPLGNFASILLLDDTLRGGSDDVAEKEFDDEAKPEDKEESKNVNTEEEVEDQANKQTSDEEDNDKAESEEESENESESESEESEELAEEEAESEDEYDEEYDEESGEEEAEEEAVADVDSNSITDSEFDEPLAASPMLQIYTTFGVMALSKKIDLFNPTVVRIARFAFISYLVILQIFVLYLRVRIKANNDRSPVKMTNPLSNLLQSQLQGQDSGNDMVKNLASSVLSSETTVMEYDLKQAKGMQGGLLFNMAFMWLLHFKFEQVQPLILSTISGLMNMLYSPLFQSYILGRNLERPFKNPAMKKYEDAQKAAQEHTIQETASDVGGDTTTEVAEVEAGDDEESDDSDDSSDSSDEEGD